MLTRTRTSPCWRRTSFPPLLRGLPHRRFRLDVDAVLGGEGHEGRDVAARGVAVRGGGTCAGQSKHPCGGASPPTQSDDGRRHVKQVFKWIGDTVVDAANKFCNEGTCHARGFGWLGHAPLGEGGVLPLLLHLFHIEHQVRMLTILVPPRPNFYHPPLGGLAVLRDKNIAVNWVAEAVHEVTSHRGGLGGQPKRRGSRWHTRGRPAGVPCARGARA